MATLTVIQGSHMETIAFQPPARLSELLTNGGFLHRFRHAHPCGGRDVCGKCTVELRGKGPCLSCRTVLEGDAEVVLPEQEELQIETDTGTVTELRPMEGTVGAAVDIGTTTIAVKLYRLADGACLGTASCLNPQTDVAADVMGRIGAAMNGGLSALQDQVLGAVGRLLGEIGEKPDAAVITGNTTMLYLLTGRDPASLSHAPFEADTLFGTETELLGMRAYLPPCMNAFVGADITCAVLAAGMTERDGTALLCDIGTNGEIALWHGGTLYVTSTAAGPAFEGAGISCGCGSVPGAIDKVTLVNGKLFCRTIGGDSAVGVCGSGLIDAVACGLASGAIDETGLLEDEALFLRDGIALTQKDIRAVQLAKAAIAAGIATLLDTAHVSLEEVQTLCIAGGFGSHLDVRSAAAIGLLPEELTSRTEILGNAALTGAVRTLLDRNDAEKLKKIAASSTHVNLGGNPNFNERYLDAMLFGEE